MHPRLLARNDYLHTMITRVGLRDYPDHEKCAPNSVSAKMYKRKDNFILYMGPRTLNPHVLPTVDMQYNSSPNFEVDMRIYKQFTSCL